MTVKELQVKRKRAKDGCGDDVMPYLVSASCAAVVRQAKSTVILPPCEKWACTGYQLSGFGVLYSIWLLDDGPKQTNKQTNRYRQIQ